MLNRIGMLVLSLAAMAMLLAVVGCGDDKPSKSEGYYEGPMKPKSEPPSGGAPGAGAGVQ